MPRPVLCAIEGCDRVISARGMCQKHYCAWRLANNPELAERKRAAERARYYRTREAKRQKYRREHEKIHDQHVQRRYGLAPGEYDRMLEAQGGVCLLCDRPPGSRRLAVDHDHETGKVRALLCSLCNRAVGCLRDDPILAERVAGYLVEHGRLFKPGVGDEMAA